jgi:DNA-binding response OmpR family regulator
MKKAIVVDDNDLIRSLISGILEQEGFEITQAQSGLILFELLEQKIDPKTIDLICLDVIMPGMNGFDVLTRLKLHSNTSNIPVIMLTAEDTAEDIMTGYNVGADYYVTKPFTPDQLLEALEIVLG